MAGNILTTSEMLGVATPVPMGNWNTTTPYQKLNIVRYNGASYMAKKQNTGFEPTVTQGWQEVWQLVVADGRGVASTTITYQAGASNTTAPTGNWFSNMPNVPQGQYLWIKTVYTFTDTTTLTSYNVAYQPLDGNSITNTTIAYQAGVSGVEVPTGEWVDDIPEVPQGQYLWTRTTINFNNSNPVVSYSVSLQGLNFTQQDRDNIDRITGAIPSTATEENLLATQDFVNSSINNMAAFYITSNENGDAFPIRANLLNATTFYSGGQTRVPTQNDYAIVLADESQPKGVNGSYPTTRYSYQGGTYPNGQWDFQYVVNNTSLTQAQVDAINSGITKERVNQISNNTTSLNSKVNKAGDTMTGALNAPSLQVNGQEVYSPFNPPPGTGSGWFTGEGAPNNIAGAVAGNFYLDTRSGNIYKFQAVEKEFSYIPAGDYLFNDDIGNMEAGMTFPLGIIKFTDIEEPTYLTGVNNQREIVTFILNDNYAEEVYNDYTGEGWIDETYQAFTVTSNLSVKDGYEGTLLDWLVRWSNCYPQSDSVTVLEWVRIYDNHPVGSYYFSNNTTSPATLFGGSWTKVTVDGIAYAWRRTS